MGGFIGAAFKFVAAIFVGAGAGASAAYALAVNVARIATLALISKSSIPKLDLSQTAVNKLVTIRGSVEPQRFVYGEDMISGPIIYGNLSGESGVDLWTQIALTGHEIDSFINYRIDDYDLEIGTDIATATGAVTAGKFVGVMTIDNQLGTATQAAPAALDAAFAEVTADHRCRGWSTMLFKITRDLDNEQDAFESGAPQNYRAVIRGRKIYDPRLDSTNGGTGAHRYADPTTWAWSNNPALCLADFIMDEKFGLNENPLRIDWPKVIAAANICEQQVPVPTAATQNRYTCNVTFDSTQQKRNVRDALVDAMLGRLIFSQGVWKMWAGAAITADVTLTEDNLAGGIQLQVNSPAKERFNRVRGLFVDPCRDYTANSYPEYRNATYLAEDNNDPRALVVDFPTANTSWEAQRNSIITLRTARNQRVMSFEGNLSCLRVQPGTVVLIDVEELGFTGEKFMVTEWELTQDMNVNLTLVEEVDSAWTAPIEGDYQPWNCPDFTINGGPGKGLLNLTPQVLHNERIELEVTAGIRLAASGQLLFAMPWGVYGDNDVPDGEWARRVRKDYYARITLNSGALQVSSGLGTWLSLSSDLTYAVVRSVEGFNEANITVQISDEADGSNILSSATFDLRATYIANDPIIVAAIGPWVTDLNEAGEVPKPAGILAGDRLIVLLSHGGSTNRTNVIADNPTWTFTALSPNTSANAHAWYFGSRTATLTADDDFVLDPARTAWTACQMIALRGDAFSGVPQNLGTATDASMAGMTIVGIGSNTGGTFVHKMILAVAKKVVFSPTHTGGTITGFSGDAEMEEIDRVAYYDAGANRVVLCGWAIGFEYDGTAKRAWDAAAFTLSDPENATVGSQMSRWHS